MSREDTLRKVNKLFPFPTHSDSIKNIIINAFDNFEKEKQEMQKQIDYWKLSFQKQCEATK